MNFISRNYTPNAMIAELISSKNKEIDWLKEEIKFLRGENEKLLWIVNERYPNSLHSKKFGYYFFSLLHYDVTFTVQKLLSQVIK